MSGFFCRYNGHVRAISAATDSHSCEAYGYASGRTRSGSSHRGPGREHCWVCATSARCATANSPRHAGVPAGTDTSTTARYYRYQLLCGSTFRRTLCIQYTWGYSPISIFSCWVLENVEGNHRFIDLKKVWSPHILANPWQYWFCQAFKIILNSC